MRPASGPPPPATDCNALLFLSCRLSYRTGQDTANCDTCRNSACIIYRYVHILFPLCCSEWQWCLPPNARIVGAHAGSILDHTSRLCLSSHPSTQAPTPGIRTQDEGEHEHVYLANAPLWYQEQVSFWWLAPLESIALSTELCSGKTVKYKPFRCYRSKAWVHTVRARIHGRSALLTPHIQVFSRNSKSVWSSPSLWQGPLSGNYNCLYAFCFNLNFVVIEAH